MVDLNKYRIYCQTSSSYKYIWKETTEAAPSACPSDSTHIIDSNSITIVDKIVSTPVKITESQPFAAKTIAEGKIYRRVHGQTVGLTANGDTIIDFVIPYNKCKITGINLSWFPEGVNVDFEVYDTPTGTLSGIANAKLNQFAFNATISKDFHRDESQYDADLIKDMKIKVVIHNPTANTKTIGVNYILHEVK